MVTTPCPGCGVAVTVGYAKCPRCHAQMPGAERPKPSAAGGTSVETAEAFVAPSGASPLVLGGIVAVAAALIIVLVVRAAGGGAHRAEARQTDEPAEPAVAPTPVAVDPG